MKNKERKEYKQILKMQLLSKVLSTLKCFVVYGGGGVVVPAALMSEGEMEVSLLAIA